MALSRLGPKPLVGGDRELMAEVKIFAECISTIEPGSAILESSANTV